MRLGGPIFDNITDPENWAEQLKHYRYKAAYCPIDSNASDSTINDYYKIAEKEDIIIAEVGAWSNPISSIKEIRDSAVMLCKKKLELAEKIGAKCCVNIAGSRGEQWDGPHSDNLTEETFEMIVETVREIIDAVKPLRAFYSLETMPWIFPDTADSYMKLICAVDRKQFAVHLDPVNMINSPIAYYNNSSIIKECFTKLGPYIKSCHAKDIVLSGNLTVHLDEIRPGLGALNYKVFLYELSKIDKDVPIMLEHLPSEEEYTKAAAYIRNEAEKQGLQI